MGMFWMERLIFPQFPPPRNRAHRAAQFLWIILQEKT